MLETCANIPAHMTRPRTAQVLVAPAVKVARFQAERSVSPWVRPRRPCARLPRPARKRVARDAVGECQRVGARAIEHDVEEVVEAAGVVRARRLDVDLLIRVPEPGPQLDRSRRPARSRVEARAFL